MFPSQKVTDHIFHDHVLKLFSIYEDEGYLYKAECPLCKEKSVEITCPERVKIFVRFSCGCADQVKKDFKNLLDEGFIHRGRNYRNKIYAYFTSSSKIQYPKDKPNEDKPNFELSLVEQSELSCLESIIEKNLQSFYDVGVALTKIRDQRLYREKYETFQEYCRYQWDISRPRAYQLIGAAGVQNNLSTVVDKLLPERILRPLTSVSPDKQIEIVEKLRKDSPDGEIIGREVRYAVNQIKKGKLKILREKHRKAGTTFKQFMGDWLFAKPKIRKQFYEWMKKRIESLGFDEGGTQG
jgi:hypothetical protein